MTKKIVFLVIDGLPDEPLPELGNKTPLEAAVRKNLDRLAQNGLCGFFKPLFLGKLPDSEEVHLALFGYDPQKNLPGRGVLEALGIEFDLKPHDIALRGNLATVNDRGVILDRRANRIQSAPATKLITALQGIEIAGIEFIVKPVYGHRLIVVMRGRGLSDQISDTDDKKIRRKRRARPLVQTRAAVFTARVLNQFLDEAATVLRRQPLNRQRKLPANFILTRSAGKLKKVQTFREKWGLKAAGVSSGALYKGIARFLGMDLIKGRNQDYLSAAYLKEKFLLVKSCLPNYDFVFCHVKGADLLAEDGQAQKKRRFIESIDKNMKILENLEDVLLVITADHATSSLTKQHEKFPIPLLIWPGSTERPDQKFTELACQKGNLGEVPNLKILPLIVELSKGRKLTKAFKK